MSEEERNVCWSILKVGHAHSPGYRLFWIFDQSGCHMTFEKDSLNVNYTAQQSGKEAIPTGSGIHRLDF